MVRDPPTQCITSKNLHSVDLLLDQEMRRKRSNVVRAMESPILAKLLKPSLQPPAVRKWRAARPPSRLNRPPPAARRWVHWIGWSRCRTSSSRLGKVSKRNTLVGLEPVSFAIERDILPSQSSWLKKKSAQWVSRRSSRSSKTSNRTISLYWSRVRTTDSQEQPRTFSIRIGNLMFRRRHSSNIPKVTRTR